MHLDARSIFDLGTVPYEEGLRIQQDYASRRAANEIGDCLLLCEHPPVYTLGTNADPRFIIDEHPRAAVIQTDRGGEVTFHGPGQQVGYAICDLNRRGRDLHTFCRDLEEVMIRVLADFGVKGVRDHGRTGVWTSGKKIGALGVRVRQWISTHGFSLNVNCDLAWYDGIVPCGIEGCRVTTIEREVGDPVDIRDVRTACARHFLEILCA